MTEPVVCANCGREVDCCAFCEEHECGDILCYRCLLYQLGEARVIVPRDED